jgi:hypothetical protein
VDSKLLLSLLEWANFISVQAEQYEPERVNLVIDGGGRNNLEEGSDGALRTVWSPMKSLVTSVTKGAQMRTQTRCHRE